MGALPKNQTNANTPPVVREYDIGGKGYIVKSIFVGDKDVKSAILKLAEQKAIREMGFDNVGELKRNSIK